MGFGQADTILSEQKKPTHFSENPNKRQSNGNFDHKDVVDKTGFWILAAWPKRTVQMLYKFLRGVTQYKT